MKTNAVMTLLGPFSFLWLVYADAAGEPGAYGVDADRAWGEYRVGRCVAASDELVAAIPLVFMLVTAAAIEFIEAVFCIYMLFNPLARHTIRLNRAFARGMRVQVPDEGLE